MTKILKFNAAGTACDIEKMPILPQAHPDIADVDLPEIAGSPLLDDETEAKVVASQPWACYDDSIITIAMTALAYREGLPAPVGRTKILDSLKSQTGKSGKLIDASVVKLHWQYQTALQQNNYYFHELLNDFDPIAPPYQKYPSVPYQACFTNRYGACFRDAATPHVTNEYIRNLLDRNFLVMLAWLGYKPKAVYDPALEGLRVTFEYLNWPHKVVVRGYQADKLPLTINYVNGPGAGKASLRSSTRPAPFLPDRGVQNDTGVRVAFGADPAHPGAPVREVVYPGGDAHVNFLEYDGQAGADDAVVFLEHIDAVCLDWRQGERRKSLSFNWGPGWTHLVPFKRGGASYMVAYNASSGLVHFDRLMPNGAHGPFVGTWAQNWTHILPYDQGSAMHLVLYNAGSGLVQFHRVRDNLMGADLLLQGVWGKWTHLSAFYQGSAPCLLAYNATTGKVRLDRVLPGFNQGTQAVLDSTWKTGWTHFLPFRLGGAAHLIAYDSKTGQANVLRVNPDLTGATTLVNEVWPAGFTALAPVDYIGLPHFTAYNATTGQVQFRRVWKGGAAVQTLWSGSHDKGCSGVVPFTHGSEAYQFFYASGAPALSRFNWQPL